MSFAHWILAAETGDWTGRAENVGLSDTNVLDQFQLPIGHWFDQMVDWLDLNAEWFLSAVKWPFDFLLENMVNDFLLVIPWYLVVIFTVVLGSLVRTPKVGLMSGAGLVMCGLLGSMYWLETMRTIGMVLVAVGLCALIGIPLGVLCARVDSAWNVIRPILDAMQTVHTFVYMVPFVFFFSIGVVPATMVTMIYALPPLVRMVNLGIRHVPEDVVEASRAYGATELRVLTDVQLPLAKPSIMAGLNQTLMLAIAMVGIAAIMGASGLGLLVFRAVQNLDVGLGISSGLALWTVAVVLDRLSQPEEGGASLLTRIREAMSQRRDPEELLRKIEAAETEDLKASKAVHVEHEVVSTGRERIGMAIVGLGGVAAVISTLMTWGSNAGLLSSHSRAVDIDLVGQSFNGYQASGGSWAGIVVLFMGFFAIMAAGSCLFWTGGIGRLLGPGGLVAAAVGVFATIFVFPIFAQFDGYVTLANLAGSEAQSVWAVAIESIAVPAILALVLGLAKTSVPVHWRAVGVWALTASVLGFWFETPAGLAAEILAVAVAAIAAGAVFALDRYNLLDASRNTWNNLGAGLVIALVGLVVSPVTSLLAVRGLVALAAAAVVYVLVGQRFDQRISLTTGVLSGVLMRWLILGSVGDSAVFLDTQIIAALVIGIVAAVSIRSGSRWFSADAMVIASACMLVASVTYWVVSPHMDVEAYSRGPGVLVAVLASAVMLVGSLLALQTAPYSAFRPLDRIVGWGRMATGVLVVVLVVVGGYSGWTFDERPGSELPPEILEQMEILREEAKLNPALAATNTSKVTSLRNKFRKNAKVTTDGFSDDGGGLSKLAIVVSVIGAALTVPASGLLGLDEQRRWRWSAAVAGVGGGLTLIGIIWIASLARVSDLKVVTGAGAFLTMFAGAILTVTSKKILTEFRRDKTYDDVEVATA
ncbi:MAG: ABC transporter permease subunit [Acidimicrobiia bacterium]|nr:ABC transporter permease subunit [Actinomycetota bacterium]MBL6924773.1 ABC transporter permease subunit [Acidimicrobiia bacterium]MBL6926442.1 ABC transporter permease subunit [Acidimicrobiia bacterium]